MATRKTGAGRAPEDQVLHRISALLHTVRRIAQHEDELCTLLHATRSRKVLTVALGAELRELLGAMPSQEYTDELEAVMEILPAVGTVAKRTSVGANRAAAARKPKAKARRGGRSSGA